MKVRGHDIGVCSWSLQPADAGDLIGKVKELGLEHVHLGIDLHSADDAKLIRDAGMSITATMIRFPDEDYTSISTIRQTAGFVPDEVWPARKELALRAGQLTAEIGVNCMSFHAGFIHASSDPLYRVLVDRVGDVARLLATTGVDLLLETGQETASELLQFLNDLNCRNIAVNFDPANMILYGTDDPIDAIEILNRHIRHVHVKDAIASSQPRMQWGKEVPLGMGEVDPLLLVDALDEIEYEGPLLIEREAGTDRMADIRLAIAALHAVEFAEE